MTQLYARVENSMIVEGPIPLPPAWRNISGFNLLSAEELNALGWLPVEDVPPTYDPSTQYIKQIDYDVGADKVSVTYMIYEDILPDYDHVYKRCTVGEPVWIDGGGKMVKNYLLIDRTADEIAASLKEISDAEQKAADIAAVLPSWLQVETAIDGISDLAGVKVFLKKLSRIVYWNVKGISD